VWHEWRRGTCASLCKAVAVSNARRTPRCCSLAVTPPPFTQSACRHASASKNRSLERNGLLARHAIYESVGVNLACLLGAELARHAQWKATPTMQDQIVSFAPQPTSAKCCPQAPNAHLPPQTQTHPHSDELAACACSTRLDHLVDLLEPSRCDQPPRQPPPRFSIPQHTRKTRAPLTVGTPAWVG